MDKPTPEQKRELLSALKTHRQNLRRLYFYRKRVASRFNIPAQSKVVAKVKARVDTVSELIATLQS